MFSEDSAQTVLSSAAYQLSSETLGSNTASAAESAAEGISTAAKALSTVVSNPWLAKVLRAIARWSPVGLVVRFCRYIASKGYVERFITWLRDVVSPAAWSMIKEALARGVMAGVGGAGSALVQKFMETKDGKWDRALTGASQPGLFNGNQAVVNKPVTSFGYDVQPSYQAQPFPFGQ